MKLIVNIVLRLILYFGILFPILEGVIPGSGWLQTGIAGLVLVVLISILELRKLTPKLIDKVLGIFGQSAAQAAQRGDVAGAIASGIAPVQSVQDCPNCGKQIELSNGRGECTACGTKV